MYHQEGAPLQKWYEENDATWVLDAANAQVILQQHGEVTV